MTTFLTTNKIISNLEDIILNAKKELTLVSPYLQLSQNIFNRLSEIDKKGIIINFVYGKTEIKNDQKSLLEKLKNVNIYYSNKLHAKCYYNENTLILSSMNLYEFSERDNLEMGVLISSDDDSELFYQVINEVRIIVQNAKVVSEVKQNTYLKSKSLAEQFIDYYNSQNSFNRLVFKVAPSAIDGAIISVTINQEPYFRILVTIGYRIEVDIRSYSNEKWLDKLYGEFNHSILGNDYTLYWDSSKSNLKFYPNQKVKENWDVITKEAKFECFGKGLNQITEELKRAYIAIKL